MSNQPARVIFMRAGTLSRSIGLAATLAFATCSLAGAPGDHDHSHHAHAEAMANDTDARVRLHERELVDRHGNRRLFKTDVIGDRIVAVTFVFTTCTTVCPAVSAIFAQVQNQLGERLDGEVRLVSVSVDPVTDTPARLGAYAERMGAGDQWVWLTGPRPDVNDVLDGFGAYTPDFTEHPAMVVVGDARHGQWTRLFGFPEPERIVRHIDALLDAREVRP